MNSLASMPSEYHCHRLVFKFVFGSTDCPGGCAGSRLAFKRSYAWCRLCRTKYSAKSASWLKQSNLSYQNIWLLIWCWQKKKSAGNTVDITGNSYPTIRRWFKLFRQRLKSSELVLSGVVEIDESFFGKKRYGHQTIVVGAIERDTRRVRLQIIPDRAQDTLELFIQHKIDRTSHLVTDALSSYSDLEFYGYTHERCNHSNGHFGPTNMIENLWGVIKRSLRTLYGKLTLTDLPNILKEWELRQNEPHIFYTVDNYLKSVFVTS